MMLHIGKQPSFANGYALNSAESNRPELRDGLIGAWCPGLGYQGRQLIDFSGYNKHGILTNMDIGSVWGSGVNGTYLDFDAVDDHVVIGSSLGGQSILTISAWVSLKSTSARAMISIIDDGANQASISIGWVGSPVNAIRLQGVTRMAGVSSAVRDVPPPLNVWVHVVFSWSNISGRAELYVDGRLIETTAITTAWIGSGNRSYIGSGDWGSSSFKGRIGNVFVYDRQLDVSQVRNLKIDPFAPLRLRTLAGLFVVGPGATPVSKTLASFVEALAPISITKISSLEVLSGVFRAIESSLESLSLQTTVSQSISSAIEAAGGIGASSSSALESTESLFGQVESALQTQAGITKVIPGRLESLILIQKEETASLEALSSLSRGFTSGLESLSLQTTVSQSISSAIEAAGGIGASSSSALESTESLFGQVESALKTQAGITKVIPGRLESLILIQKEETASLEALSSLSRGFTSGLESLSSQTTVSQSISSPIETNVSMGEPVLSGLEAKGFLSSQHRSRLESLQSLEQSIQSEYAYLQAVSKSSGASIESLMFMATSNPTEIESGLGVQVVKVEIERRAVFALSIEKEAEF